MGRKLYRIQASGDLSIAKFFPLFDIIIKSTEFLENGLGDVPGPLLKTRSPLCCSRVPKPSPWPEWQSAGGCHYDVQGGFRLSDASQSSFSPCQSGTGHAALEVSPSLLPMPTYTVSSCCCFSKWLWQCGQPHHFTSLISQFSCPTTPKWSTSLFYSTFSHTLHRTWLLPIPCIDGCNCVGTLPFHQETLPYRRPHPFLFHCWLLPHRPTPFRFPQHQNQKWP